MVADGGMPGSGGGSGGAEQSSGGNAVAGSGGITSGGSGGTPNSGGNASSGGTSVGGSEVGSGGSTDFFGASRCDGREFLVCDGFETGAIDTTRWSVGKNGSNVVEISSEVAARGAQSVHIRAENGFGYLKNTSAFPVPGNDYFGRMFLRVKRFSEVSYAHWTVVEAAGTGDGSVIRAGGQFADHLDANRWGVGSDGGPTGDWTTHDTDPSGNPSEPPTQTWVCLEWEHRGSEDVTRLFVDGMEHPSLQTSSTMHGGESSSPYVLPDMASVWVGWWQYQSDPEPFDVWIDEVALDDERIGCAD